MTKQFGTPGPRAIHPELCDSPSLARCSLLANALFPRLVAQADDQGRFAGDAYAVLVLCMGRLMRLVGVDEVEAALEELASVEAIIRYTDASGSPLLQLTTWWRWQNGQRRAYPSRWAAPPGWSDLVYGCAAAPADVTRFEEALSRSPRRNAAVRGIPQQSAATSGNPPPTRAPMRAPMRAGAQAPVPARAVPSTVPDTVPSRAARGANGAPPAAGEKSEFRQRVPFPVAAEGEL